MLTVKQIMEKNKGDAVPEFQGTIEHVFDYRPGTADDGTAYAYQGIVLLDSANEKIELNLGNRVPLPKTATAVYVAAVPSKKKGDEDKLVGATVDIREGKKRIKATVTADVRVYINNAWANLAVMEEKKAAPPPPPNGAPAAGPAAPQGPAAPGTPPPAEQKGPDAPPPAAKPANGNGNGYAKPLTEFDIRRLEFDREKNESIIREACLSSATQLVVAGKLNIKDLVGVTRYFVLLCHKNKTNDFATGTLSTEKLASACEALDVENSAEVCF